MAQLEQARGVRRGAAAQLRAAARGSGRPRATYFVLPEATPGSRPELVRLPADRAAARRRSAARRWSTYLEVAQDRHPAALRRQPAAPAGVRRSAAPGGRQPRDHRSDRRADLLGRVLSGTRAGGARPRGGVFDEWRRIGARRAPAMSEFSAGRPVLVTGATGLLGSWMVDGLLSRGARVVALVRDIVPDALFFTGGGAACVLVLGDVEDGRLIERVLAEHEIDAVFHLAAQTDRRARASRPGGHLPLERRRHLGGARRVPPRAAGRPACWSRRRTRHTATRLSCPTTRASAPGTPSVRRLEELRRPDRARLRGLVRPARGDHPLREPVRRRRPEFQPDRAGNHPRRAGRPAAGAAHDGRPVRDYLYIEDAVEAYVALAERAHEPQSSARRGTSRTRCG